MKKKLNIGFVVTLSGRWPRELPEKRLKEYGNWLEQNAEHAEVFRFPRLVSSKDDMNECAAYFTENKVDLIVLVYGAFTGDDIPCGLADKCRCPIVLWAPREEKWERQDRLYANALCSATMNGASLARIHAPHSVIFGDKEEARVKTEISNLISAYAVIKNLQGFTFGLFGYRPTAFYNCAFDETVIRRVFGINFEETDLKVVFDTMAELPWSEVEAEMARIDGDWDTKALPDGHLENHARLYLALKQLVAKQEYEYSALKCWPEMGNLHTTPCAVIGRLADEGIGLSCEGDRPDDAYRSADVHHRPHQHRRVGEHRDVLALRQRRAQSARCVGRRDDVQPSAGGAGHGILVRAQERPGDGRPVHEHRRPVPSVSAARRGAAHDAQHARRDGQRESGYARARAGAENRGERHEPPLQRRLAGRRGRDDCCCQSFRYPCN